MKKKYTTQSSDETKAVAKEFAIKLKGGELVELIGELGSGKTTFVQGLTAAFGYTDPVRSPTFSIMNVYESGKKRIIHLDFYRVEDEREVSMLGLEELVGKPDTIVIVEWPRNMIDHSRASAIFSVQFKVISESSREIEIKKESA